MLSLLSSASSAASSSMPLIDLARQLFPRFYWSAGFIAVLFGVIAVSFILYVVTKWSPWLVVCLAGGCYMVPFLANFNV